MVEVAQSYEMVRNFKAFVMCCLLLFEYAYVSPENFSDLPPRQHFREKFVRLGQNPRKCWSKHDDTPPPPNVDGFTTSLSMFDMFLMLHAHPAPHLVTPPPCYRQFYGSTIYTTGQSAGPKIQMSLRSNLKGGHFFTEET